MAPTSRSSYSTEVKYAALQDIAKGLSRKAVAAKYGCTTNSIGDWLKAKDRIYSEAKSASSGKFKA